MSRYLLVTMLLLACSITNASRPSQVNATGDKTPVISIGSGAGYNNLCGVLGARTEINIRKHLAFTAGIGFGNRDVKAGGRVNIYIKPKHLHGYIFAGGTYSTGTFGTFEERLLGVEIYTSGIVAPLKREELVDVKLLPVSTIDLGYGYAFHLGDKARYFFVEAGYSLATTNETYEVDFSQSSEPDVSLTEKSVKKIECLIPGGVIVGIGVYF